MLTLTSDQDAILGATAKRVSWLFTVTVDSVVYYWSTKGYTYGGDTYDNRVVPETFNGVELNRSMSEHGIQAPSGLAFDVVNDDASLTADDFEGCDVRLDLVLSDWSDEQVVASWRFTVLTAVETQGLIHFTCEDFLSAYLDGDYPNEPPVSQLAPDPSLPNDNVCVPVPFGTVYVPLRSVYHTDQRYYLLGPSAYTYTLYEIRSPEDWGSVSTWDHDSTHDFVQYTKTLDGTSYKMFQAIIADDDEDGTPDSPGVWTQGGKMLDPYVRFSRSDTASTTNPADIIEQVLLDMGVAAGDIDTGGGSSFAAAKTTYTGWGLDLNGAFFYKMPRAEALSMLLASCGSVLRVTDKIELHVLSKASVMTIDTTKVLKSDTVGPTTLAHTKVVEDPSDYGFVAYVQADTPQGEMVKLKAAAKGTYNVSSGDTLELPLVNDGQLATRAGILYFQRLLGVVGECGFSAIDECLVLQPSDVITVDDPDYGSTFTCIIDSVVIHRNLTVTVTASKNKYALDDWDDLSPDAVSVVDDDTTVVWSPVVSGPSSDGASGSQPNLIHGTLRVGSGPSYILIDSNSSQISLHEGGVTRLVLGDLGSAGYGITAYDGTSDNDVIFNIDADSALIAGWSFDAGKLYTAEILIDAANHRIRSSNYVGGADGAGFTIEEDLVEAGNLRARGMMQSVVLRKDCISAISGDQLIVKNADVLDADMTALDASTLTITGTVTFAANDKLRLKSYTHQEWMTVVSAASAPTYTVTRDRAGAYSANSNPAWPKGTAVVNYGQTSDYGILLTAHQTNNPYISFFQVPASPWTSGITEIVRVGQLNGFAGYSATAFGLAVYYSSLNYLKMDATNGIQMAVTGANAISIAGSGGITVSSGGSISVSGGGGITIADTGLLTLLAGGDIIMTSSVGDAAKLRFKDSTDSYPAELYCSNAGSVYLIGLLYPELLYIGTTTYYWSYVYVNAMDNIELNARYTAADHAQILLTGSSDNANIKFYTGAKVESLVVEDDGDIKVSRGDIILYTGELLVQVSGTTEGRIYALSDTLYMIPPTDGASSCYIGTSSYRFANAYIFASTQALLRYYSDTDSQAYFAAASIYCRMYTIGSGSFVDAYTAGSQRWKIDSSGDMYMYGGSIVIPDNEYLNFGGTQGDSGWGIKSVSGTMYKKNSGGSWVAL